MGKELVIEPVTRIEGHAKVVVQLDDTGNVSDAKVQILELRGFEKFCIGRPVEELPQITPRICGVCPWAHHMASAKATDAVFGVKIPEAARKLREMSYVMEAASDKILHFYFLSGPDFVMGPNANYKERNVIGIAQKFPDLARKAVRARHLGAQMVEIVAGKNIHPVAAVPGGFGKVLKQQERDKCREMAKEVHDFAVFSMKMAKEEIFPKYIDLVKSLAVFNTSFLGTVTQDGAMNFYDGKLRMMSPDGSYEDFQPENYLDYISEQVRPWSYPKFPYLKKTGKLNIDPDDPVGVYRVNALARVNVCDKIPTPLAQEELKEFRKLFGRPAQPTLLYHWARLIELLYASERTLELLEDPEILSKDIRTPVTPRAARGVGVVEAPRGTLIHDYETDANGMIKDVNLIVATVQNNAAINMSVQSAARQLIKNGNIEDGVLNKLEMVIRPYDPCLSCSTHSLPGNLGFGLDVVDSQGQLIRRVPSLQ
jgi:F420-non-reducing hydrogenase large subunit